MSKSSPINADNFLGYRLIERIGSGGYGEVWRAEAPGGMQKAIKILYGFHDERRAQLELKSLDKIKQLRHPFLLSLERIDVVEDQLIVITELADRSLADLFNDYVSKGAKGIPRDELLEFLKQTAEALDFIASEHSLQHLDVKPENLLLVGRHAKLADFGLVKNLQECNQSLLGGLTPAYAAPELFDGRPSLQSDQYSLAVVYQEMLHGERCFDGTSPAQLASQHMHAQPNLSSLSKSDQAIVGRALSKKPELRYKSCRAFIDELIQRRSIIRENKRSQMTASRLGSGQPKLFDSRISQPGSVVTRSVSISQVHGKKIGTKVVAPPPRVHITDSLTPTLFIGVGKTGTLVCQDLKRRVQSRYGSLSQIPTFKILCIDSDRVDLSTATGGSDSSALECGETFPVPLRKPEEYRERSRVHSEWLNRRWIYNIPKSKNTEGLRPLGRLAFVDNFQGLWQKLDESMESLLSTKSNELASSVLNQPIVAQKARVFIVTSISGGIGSGMALDLAYTLKMVLRENNCDPDQIFGIFVNSCNAHERENGIAQANAFSFLTELRHYTEKGYPGENACGIPPLEDDLPIDFPYYLDLGLNVPEKKWNQHLGQIAEYLFLNSFQTTPAFFNDCRELEKENESFTLRSFGLADRGLRGNHLDLMVESIQKELFNRWLGHSSSAKVASSKPIQRHPWTELEQIQSLVLGAVRQSVSNLDLETAKGKILSEIFSDQKLSTSLFAPFRKLYGHEITVKTENDTVDLPLGSLRAQHVFSQIRDQKDNWAGQLHEEVIRYFKGSRFSFKSINDFLKNNEVILHAHRDTARRETLRLKQEFDAAESQFIINLTAIADRKQLEAEIKDFVEKHQQSLEQILSFEVVFLFCRFLILNFNPLRERIERLKMLIQSHSQLWRSDSEIMADIQALEGFDRGVLNQLLQRQEIIVDLAEEAFYQEQVAPQGGYEQLFLSESFSIAHIAEQVKQVAREQIVVSGCQVDLDQVLFSLGETEPSSFINHLVTQIESSKPFVDGCGGMARMLVAVPEFAPALNLTDSIERLSGYQFQRAEVTCGELVMVMEAEKIALADVAHRIALQRTDSLELAKRLHTRHDVSWKSMDDLFK